MNQYINLNYSTVKGFARKIAPLLKIENLAYRYPYTDLIYVGGGEDVAFHVEYEEEPVSFFLSPYNFFYRPKNKLNKAEEKELLTAYIEFMLTVFGEGWKEMFFNYLDEKFNQNLLALKTNQHEFITLTGRNRQNFITGFGSFENTKAIETAMQEEKTKTILYYTELIAHAEENLKKSGVNV